MSNDTILDIENLAASVGGTQILQGLSLRVGQGEVHAIRSRSAP